MILLAWSSDPAVRLMASSGGFTKELLRAALLTGYVDYLVFPRTVGAHAEVVVTDDPDEVFTPTTNSIYQPVAPLRGLQSIPNGRTCAITLLTCHAEAASRYNKIKLTIELLCGKLPKFVWTEKSLQQLNVDVDDVANLSYRGGVWPGCFSIITNDGRHISHRYPPLWNNDPTVDAPIGCRYCDRIDPVGDVVVGDPWGLERKYHSPGKTLVRVVNPEIMSLIESGRITYEIISENEWDHSLRDFVAKKRGNACRKS